MSTNGNATVNFRVSDNGIGSFMDNIKRKADTMANDMIRQAQLQNNSTKEQTAIINEQMRLLERKAQIERTAALEQAKISRDNRLARLDQYRYDRVTDIQGKMRSKQITGKEGRKQIEEIQTRTDDAKDKVQSHYSEKVTGAGSTYREAALTNQLLRQGLDTARNLSREQLNQMRRGDESIVNAVDETAEPMDRFVNQSASQQFEEEKNKEKEEKKKDPVQEQWTQFIKAFAFEKAAGLASTVPGAKNELDFIKPLTSVMGMAMGGLAGNLLDMVNVKILGNGLGQTNFGALGTGLGEKAGEFFGTAMERGWKGRDELTSSNYKLQALVGKDLGIDAFKHLAGRGLTRDQVNGYDFNAVGKDGKTPPPQGFEKYGADFAQESELMYQSAQRTGYAKNMHGNAENVLAAQQGIGVSKETSYALMEMQRSSKETDRDFLRTLGGVLQEGVKGIFKEDRAFLNEFMSRNFINMQKELLKTNNRVHTGTTMDILQKFDSMGGQFSARDPRSMNLINQINESIAHPGSDNMKALSFNVMRRLHPEMGFFDTRREIQHGMASPKYLQSMMQSIMNMGGGADMVKMNIAGAFGLTENLDAVETLYKNRGKIMKGQFSMKDLKGEGQYGQEAIRQQGQDQTSVYTQSTAQIQNAFIGDVVKAVGLVGAKMGELFGDMTEQLKKYIMDKLSSDDSKANAAKYQNAVYTGAPGQVRSPSGFNMKDPVGRRSAIEAGDYGSKQ